MSGGDITLLLLDYLAPRLPHKFVECPFVSRDRLHENSPAQRAQVPLPLRRKAPGVTIHVGGIVLSAVFHRRLIQKRSSRILTVGIFVQDIASAELTEGKGKAIDILGRAQLVFVAAHRFRLATQTDRVPQKKSRGVVFGGGGTRTRGFAMGKSRDAHRTAQARALRNLGVVINFAAMPELSAQKHRQGRRMLILARRVQTIQS